MTAEEIYLKGIERMQCFYYGDDMHSTDYKRMILEENFVPAAEMGCVRAMKECGYYYSSIDRDKAIKYYKLYLNHCPGDTLTKAFLIAKFGFRLLM